MNDDGNVTPLMQAAIAMREMYLCMIEAGFTMNEAAAIIAAQLKGAE